MVQIEEIEEKEPVRVAVTGAAGQIAYSLVFRIASGAMFGPEQPVILQLLEVLAAVGALQGVAMELDDCAFPLLAGVVATDDPSRAFAGANLALLLGARPRTKGMERRELLSANAAIFSAQGQALSSSAADNVRVLVVGNPANTNCLIAMSNAPTIAPERFTAMTRLDHNRAIAQLAAKVGTNVTSVRRMTIWGNHSTTQYPDLRHAEVNGRPAIELISDEAWVTDEFIPTVQQRGAAVIEARGASSAASAAHAVVCHVQDWLGSTPDGDWVSMGVVSDGSYDIPAGVVYSYPVTTAGGSYQIVPGLEIDEASRARMEATKDELFAERTVAEGLGLLDPILVSPSSPR